MIARNYNYVETVRCMNNDHNHLHPKKRIPTSQPNDEIWYTSSDGLVVTPYKTLAFGANIISNTYDGEKGIIKFDGNVVVIGLYVFNSRSSLTGITIPDSVISIEDYAFYGCSNMTDVIIGNSVTSIGGGAFMNCTSLTNISISNSVTIIKQSAFDGCSSLTNVIIPDSVTNIRSSAFENCSGLISITIGNSVASIGDYIFSHCSSLTSITIPDSVTSIGTAAFDRCTSLTSITSLNPIPPSLGSNVFYQVPSDCPIYVPASSVDAYKSASKWTDRKNYIFPIQ